MRIHSFLAGAQVWQITGRGVRLVLIRRFLDPATARVSRWLNAGLDSGFVPAATSAPVSDLFATESAARIEAAQRRNLTHSAADRRCLLSPRPELAA
jgi:hypothetical protein